MGRIRIPKPTRGSPDGVHVHTFDPGEYDENTWPMSPALADALVAGGLATRTTTKTQPADYEKKITEPRTTTAFDPSTRTVKQVLAAVDAGQVEPQAAYDAEKAGEHRVTLLHALSERGATE